MKFLGHLFLGVLLVFLHFRAALGNGHGVYPRIYGLNVIDRTAPALSPSFAIDVFNRSSFPPGFIFGAASSAYQVEGAWNIDGKGPSIWDTFTHKYPGKIQDGKNGTVAIDSYHLYKDFQDYANVCFERFGDRVKYWITFNEPWSFSSSGYDSGDFAPGRCSSWMENNCTGGDSSTEPYLTAHHQLLAHAEVVELYKKKYQARQKGKIGITLVSTWMVPFSNSSLDKLAAFRALDFMFGWFMNPLVCGKYPRSMRDIVGNRLPNFTEEQSKKLTGSYDFLGLNYYTAFYAAHIPTPPNKVNLSYSTDQHVNLSWERNGTLIGAQAGSEWLHVYPIGIRDLLLYIKRNYSNPIIYITENGIDEVNDPKLSLEKALQDSFRIKYYYRHLWYVKKAIDKGVQVKGYYGWSVEDNMEWAAGYTVRFGINFVDFDTLQRYRKLSSCWFERFLQK